MSTDQNIVEELTARLLALIPSYPDILLMSNDSLHTIPGFRFADLHPSRAQVATALAQAQQTYRQQHMPLDRSVSNRKRLVELARDRPDQLSAVVGILYDQSEVAHQAILGLTKLVGALSSVLISKQLLTIEEIEQARQGVEAMLPFVMATPQQTPDPKEPPPCGTASGSA